MGVVLSFIGAPGSGKGTQGELLQAKFGFVHIPIGDLFREKMKGTDDGAREIRKRYEQGIPQPDDVATHLVLKRLEGIVAGPGIILDPFPLSSPQIDALNTFIAAHSDIFSSSYLIDFIITEEESVKRLLNRHETQGRSDDTEAVVRKRFKEYQVRMQQIIPFYKEQQRYIELDGLPIIDVVYDNLVDVLKQKKLLPSV